MNLNNISCNENAAYFAIQHVSRHNQTRFLYFFYYYYFYHYRSIKSSVIKVRRILLPGYFRDTPYNRGGEPTPYLFLSLRERVVRYIMFHYLTFTFSQKRVGTHKVRSRAQCRQSEIKTCLLHAYQANRNLPS